MRAHLAPAISYTCFCVTPHLLRDGRFRCLSRGASRIYLIMVRAVPSFSFSFSILPFTIFPLLPHRTHAARLFPGRRNFRAARGCAYLMPLALLSASHCTSSLWEKKKKTGRAGGHCYCLHASSLEGQEGATYITTSYAYNERGRWWELVGRWAWKKRLGGRRHTEEGRKNRHAHHASCSSLLPASCLPYLYHLAPARLFIFSSV